METCTRSLFATVAIFLIGVMTMPNKSFAVTAEQIVSPFLYNFDNSGTLQEIGNQSLSDSGYWWLNSGAKMIMKNGGGGTIEGALPLGDEWRSIYASHNPVDTDNGTHPQNIFRLVSRTKWLNFRQEAYFDITKDNLSSSSNRNASNGILLFNRYQDGDNLYYTGVRVDGSAIIKKKRNGIYYTLSEVKNVYLGTYNRTSNPSLLPKNKWIGLRSEITNESGGKVRIKLFVDKGWTGSWQLISEVVDDGVKYGPAIITSGYTGIRTDFMDVKFDNFRLRNI